MRTMPSCRESLNSVPLEARARGDEPSEAAGRAEDAWGRGLGGRVRRRVSDRPEVDGRSLTRRDRVYACAVAIRPPSCER